ncbi:MAG: hypothetical protein JKY92_10220 [Magnetovibrio sp.]|nr:hypothetical protein [Magnetovibrio sp.]
MTLSNSKFSDREISDAKRRKTLELENAKPKKILAEQVLNAATLKEMLEKTCEARVNETWRGLRSGGV